MADELLKSYKEIEAKLSINQIHSQFGVLRNELTISTREASLTERLSPEDYELRLGDAYDWLLSLYVQIRSDRYDSDEIERPGFLWAKKDIARAIFLEVHEARAELNYQGGSQREVENSVSVYLSREWMWSDHISFILIDYFLCEEIIEYINQLKTTNPDGSINRLYMYTLEMEQQWQKYAVRILGPYIWKSFQISWPLVASYLCYYYQLFYLSYGFLGYWAWSVFPIRFPVLYLLTTRKLKIERQRMEKLLEETAKFYNNFGGTVISPSFMHEKLQQFEQAGWVFNQSIHAILDRAIERDPNVMKGLELIG